MSFSENIDILHLIQKLKQIGFEVTHELVQRIRKGDPWTFVSIYNYLFFESEKCINRNISHGISPEAYNKNDEEKVSGSGIYKILKTVFGYIPRLTLEEFIANNHAKQKVLMCQDVIKLIQDRTSHLKACDTLNKEICQQGDGYNTRIKTEP
ncbi:hypothetical protein L9F63_012443 [Diploptera punctata]|uniref:Centrosomal CEP44 domain-containing protein n=1 Tax=Diploptera punctata TaxID=6984 RepID=A0AAD8ACH3_DIPPU|nr:hypothetical protein L9F63_012443 [Diploptera punctata]